MLADEILEAEIPLSTQPHWDEIDAPGLGLAVDAGKLDRYHQLFLPWAVAVE